MRITMLTIGSTGDVRPYILLGLELQSRGHNVTIATFSRFREMIEKEGIHFFPLSGDAEKLMSSIMSPSSSGITYLSRLEKSIKSVAPQLIQDMADSCASAVAMICNFFGSVYYSIAEKYNIPCIQTHFFPMDPTRNQPISSVRHQHLGAVLNESTYRVGYLLISTVEKHYLTPWRKKNGVSLRHIKSLPDYRAGNHPIPVIYAVSPLIMPRPADWNSHIQMSGFWFDESPVSWSPPADLESFLSRDPVAPIYIGFGSMTGRSMSKLMAIVLHALHSSGTRAIVNLGWSGQQLRSNHAVYFTNYVSHDWLFPRVRAVVHHGGAGTTAAGLRYGRPTLIIPFAGDQSFWGNRVHSLGCGPRPIARDKLTVQNLTKALLDINNHYESYASEAGKIMNGLAQEHGVSTAADQIEAEIARW